MTRLNDLFESAVTKGDPGIAVGIARQGVVLYRRGFGLANSEWGIPNCAATRMRIGSTTKQFTCLSLLLLEEDGLLDLDGDIREWVPQIPASIPPLSPRLIMQHRSGLRCNLDLWMIGTGSRARLPDGEPLEQILRLTSLNAPPGDRVIYSNGGYVVLAHLIEHVSGLSLGEFMTRRIFQPLHMHATQMLAREETLLSNCATLHAPRDAGKYRRGQMLTPMSGEGGLVSNVDDLLLWLRHMDAPTIGNADTWSEMRTRPRLPNGSISDYGLGLITRPYRGVTLLGHAGAVVGGHTEVFKVLEHGLDVVLLANRSDLKINALARTVIDIALGQHLEPAMKPALTHTFSSYCGTYYRPASGEVLDIGTSGEQLIIDFGGVQAPIYQNGEDLRFSGSIEDIDLSTWKDDRGALQVTRHGQGQRFERLAACHVPDWQEVQRLPGRYRCAELPGEIEVTVTGARVRLGLQVPYGRLDYVLHPLANALWLATPMDPTLHFRVTVEIEWGLDGCCTLHLSTMRTLRLAFTQFESPVGPSSLWVVPVAKPDPLE